MRKSIIALACTASLGLAGCMSPADQQIAGGLAAGAAGGFLTGKILGADNDWVVVTTLAGAAIGTLVAQNAQTGQCAYARGDGTYYTAPCPS